MSSMNARKAILASDDSPIRNGDSLWSTAGEFQLLLQPDGNLVLYRVAASKQTEALWSTGAHGPGDYALA